MPYIFLNIAKDNKLIAFHRFYMNEYYHSQSNDAQSQHCGKVQTIYIKVSRLC